MPTPASLRRSAAAARLLPLTLAGTAALTASLLAAAPAHAAEGTTVQSHVGGLFVSARAGVPNDVKVGLTDSTFTVTDRDVVIPGQGCVSIARNIAECEVLGDDVNIATSDLDDRVSAPVALPVLVNGGTGADTITTGAAKDQLNGAAGDDRLDAGGGNDELVGGAGADDLHGGAGLDIVDYPGSTGVTVTLDDLPGDGAPGENDNVHSDVEDVHGTSGDDTLTGSNLATVTNKLFGEGGTDTLRGLAGRDLLFGDAGNDTLEGGEGNDDLDGGTGADSMSGGNGSDEVSYSTRTARVLVDIGAGGANDGETAIAEKDDVKADVEDVSGGSADDRLTGTSAANTLIGGSGSDVFVGGEGDDLLLGGSGFDSMSGQGGNDTLRGDSDNDTLIGGLGDDDLDGGFGVDTVSYAERQAGHTVIATIDDVDNDGEPALAEKDDIFSTVENITGGSGSDFLTGRDDTNNVLDGGQGIGNDVLRGLGGDDTLDGFLGSDTLECGAGTNDTGIGGPSIDTGFDTATGCETVIGVP